MSWLSWISHWRWCPTWPHFERQLFYRYLQIRKPFLIIVSKAMQTSRSLLEIPDYRHVWRSTLISPVLVISVCPFLFFIFGTKLEVTIGTLQFSASYFCLFTKTVVYFWQTFLFTQHMISRCHFLLDFWMHFLFLKANLNVVDMNSIRYSMNIMVYIYVKLYEFASFRIW